MAVTYSRAIANSICERLAAGESLRAICKGSDYPTETAVRLWVDEDRDGFASHYARARERGYARFAEEIVELADTPSDDNGSVQRNRLQVDTRKWILSKMLPKVYGDRLNLEHSGKVGTTPDLSTDELLRIAAQAAQKPDSDA